LKRIFATLGLVILIPFSLIFSQTDSLNIYWNANTESDMFQYKLYRAEGGSGNFQLIQSIPHPLTHAVDRDNIHPGQLYSYKLAAMDSSGNLSPLTDAVSVGIPRVILSLSEIPSEQTTSIPLTDVAEDPDNAVADLQITVSNLNHLTVSVNGGNLEITPEPNNYSGPAELTVRVEDPAGFWDKKVISLTVVSNVQYVFTVSIPPISFPEDSQFELWLDTCVTVSPYTPADLTWEILGLNHLQADYQASSRKVTFTSSTTNWFGQDTIVFQATDPDQNTKTDQVVVTVTPVNDPPKISLRNIFTSAVSSNVFDLKPYASDPDNQPLELTWQFVGYSHFQFQWENEAQKIVKIISLDNTTSEDGKFIVTDPAGASDTSIVTIHYNPSHSNSPPVLNFPISVDVAEDSFRIVQLGNYVVDSTNTLNELVWDIQPGEHLHTEFNEQQVTLKVWADPDWWGESDVWIRVQDPGGLSAEGNLHFKVEARVDMAGIQFVPMEDGRMNVRIQTDIPSRVEMTYWNDPSRLFTYRSQGFAKIHDFYLTGLIPDTTYSYSLTLIDTSGYQTTTSDSVFRYQEPDNVAAEEGDIIVYPNPFRLSRGHEFVYFSNLPSETEKIVIYTIAGEKVNEISLDGAQLRRMQWKPMNSRDQQLASGLYVYIIKNREGKKIKTGKLAVIR
jgi:hypothetical protein